MHIGSGVDYAHLSRVCEAMVDAVMGLGHDIEAISAGGGLSVPYREGEPRIDKGPLLPALGCGAPRQNGVPSNAPIGSCAVAGPLCEAGDVFTQAEGGVVTSRAMPTPEVGDLIVFHDAGAYGASMSSNYNSRPLAPEVLLEQGKPRLIRRRQSVGELIALEMVGE